MSEEKQETLPATEIEPDMQYLTDKSTFEHGLRVAKMFAASKLVPDIYKNNPADCFLVLHRAARMGIEPIFLMEHSYVLHGKVAVDGQACKAVIDASGIYTGGLELEYSGTGEGRACTAYALLPDGRRREVSVSYKLAKDEGWAQRNSKWNTMTDQMLAYRAAAFFVKRYHPALLGGAMTVEEAVDVNGVTVLRRGRRSALNEVLEGKNPA